jgi:hypothetical protein
MEPVLRGFMPLFLWASTLTRKEPCPLRGSPAPSGTRLAQRRDAAAGERTPKAYCNAPYARVLRARIARISAGLGPVPVGAGVAILSGNWHQMVTGRAQFGAKSLISFGTMWVPVVKT